MSSNRTSPSPMATPLEEPVATPPPQDRAVKKEEKYQKKVEKKKKKKEQKKRKKEAGGKSLTKADQERSRQLGRSVPLGFLQETLSKSLEARRLMSGMVFYILFIIMFVFFFMARRDLEAEYFMAHSVLDWTFGEELPPTSPLTPTELNTLPYFEKLFSEVSNWPDWYDWVEAVLMPQLFVSAPDNTWDRRITGQNIPVGALRIRAKHVRDDSCRVNEAFYPEDQGYHPRVCYAQYSPEAELRQNRNVTSRTNGGNHLWNYTEGCDGWPLMFLSAEYADYDCSGYNIDIPFNTTLEDALVIAKSLRDGDFALIISARLLSVEFFTYNPSIDAFVSVKMFAEITPGGAYLPQQRFRPFRVHNPNDIGWAIYYLVFMLVVFVYAVKFVLQWMRHKRLHGLAWTFLLDLWNLLEIINLASFVVVFALVFFWWSVSVDINWQFPTDEPDFGFPLALQSCSEGFFLQVYFNALNTVIVFLKIMKYLRLNNRLNILQRTMEAAAQSIFGVIIIFMLVVSSYTFSGYSLYGTRIWDYRSTDEAFAALCRLLVGVFDYPAMRDSNRAMTFLFFWSFTVLGLFILLNFIIAVVMHGFGRETARVRTVPLDIAIQQSLRSTKQLLMTPGFFAKLFSSIVSSARKMPEKELYEYASTYITTMKFSRDQLYGEAYLEDELGTRVEEEPFFRHDWERVMPRSALEDIGEEYINTIWCEIVTEYENTQINDDERKVEDICRTIHEAVAEAATRTFLRHKRTLFGESELNDKRPGAGEENASVYTGTVLRKHIMRAPQESMSASMSVRGGAASQVEKAGMGGWDNGSSEGGSEDALAFAAEAEREAEKQLERNAFVTSKGTSATSAGQIVEDLEERLDRIERRYACLGELMATIEEKIVAD